LYGYHCIDYAKDCRGKKLGEVNFCLVNWQVVWITGHPEKQNTKGMSS